MTSEFYELDCGEDEPVVMERTTDGETIFRGFDIDAELAAQELGFAPSICFRMWGATRAVDDEGLTLGPSQLREVIVELLEIEDQDSLDRAFVRVAATQPASVVAALLGAGADLEAYDEDALVKSSKHGNAAVVKLLLRHGADVHTSFDAPLLMAATNGHPDVVQILVDAGANVNEDNDRPLRWAAGEGHADVIQILIDNGSDPHAEEDEALAFAAMGGHADIIQILLADGMSAEQVDYAQRTASNRGHIGTVRILQDWRMEHG